MRQIETTHVGSLPRPAALIEPIVARDRGGSFDSDELRQLVSKAVDETVLRQIDAGVDHVSDGEMSKVSYTNYLKHRIAGFGDGTTPLMSPRDLDENPEFAAFMVRNAEDNPLAPPACVGPLSISDDAPLREDLTNFMDAVKRHQPKSAFMNAASPGVIAIFMPNQYYPAEDDYVWALADIMQHEYDAIARAGFTLQIDAPDLAMGRHTFYKNLTLAQYRQRAARNVEALNHATRNIKPEKLRMHLCWGNYPGPHTCDVALADILDIVMKVRAQTILFEAANPRHAHEHAVWADQKHHIPDDKILCPGVLDTNSNCIEHPELIAERLLTFARIVGGDRIMAGSDCGFSTVADRPRVFPSLVWQKLRAQSEGAQIASQRLWG